MIILAFCPDDAVRWAEKSNLARQWEFRPNRAVIPHWAIEWHRSCFGAVNAGFVVVFIKTILACTFCGLSGFVLIFPGWAHDSLDACLLEWRTVMTCRALNTACLTNKWIVISKFATQWSFLSQRVVVAFPALRTRSTTRGCLGPFSAQVSLRALAAHALGRDHQGTSHVRVQKLAIIRSRLLRAAAAIVSEAALFGFGGAFIAVETFRTYVAVGLLGRRESVV